MGIPLNFGLDAGYKQGRFPKILSKKGLVFVLNRKYSIVTFDLSLMKLPAKINLIIEKRGCKRHGLRAHSIG